MSRRSPFVIDLAADDRQQLESLVRRQTAEQRMVTRAWIVLEAADGEDNAVIAEHLGVALNTVIKWRKRFFEEGVNGFGGAEAIGSTPTFFPLWRSPRSRSWPVRCPPL
jgi:hypothetical protein